MGTVDPGPWLSGASNEDKEDDEEWRGNESVNLRGFESKGLFYDGSSSDRLRHFGASECPTKKQYITHSSSLLGSTTLDTFTIK